MAINKADCLKRIDRFRDDIELLNTAKNYLEGVCGDGESTLEQKKSARCLIEKVVEEKKLLKKKMGEIYRFMEKIA